MDKRIRLWPVAIVLILAASAAWAMLADNTSARVIGVGVDSCGEFLQAVDAERKARPATFNSLEGGVTVDYLMYLSWADGYLSGANFRDPENRMSGRNTSHETRMRWLEKHCREDPLRKFVFAIEDLRDALGAR